MPDPYDWSEGNYNAYSWHDNRIRTIRFRSPLEGYDCDLILEIDHITEWLREGDRFSFMVAPALLIFHNVDQLSVRFDLSYKQDLDIDYIGREDITTEDERKHGLHYDRYTIACHGFTTEHRITFTATGFEMKLLAEPTRQNLQRLEDPPIEPRA